MRYSEVTPIDREEAAEAFSSDDVDKICDALVRLTFHDRDWNWVQGVCLTFGRHPDPQVRGLAATCLGHLARIHGTLDVDSAVRLLEDLRRDPEVRGRAEDALDDIRQYAGASHDGD
jgi:hypothetical protein